MALISRFVVYSVLMLPVLAVHSAVDESDVFGYCGGGFSDPSQIPQYSSETANAKGSWSVNAPAPGHLNSRMLPLHIPPLAGKVKLSPSKLKELEEDRGNRSFVIKAWHTKRFYKEISNNVTTKKQYEMVINHVINFFSSFLGVERHSYNGTFDVSNCLDGNTVNGVKTVPDDEQIVETGGTKIPVEEADWHLILKTGWAGSCKGDSNVLAFASPCGSLRQSTVNYRRLMGLTYLCPQRMTGDLMQNIAMQSTIKHEIFHALGVNSGYLGSSSLAKKVETTWPSAYGSSFKKNLTYLTQPEVRDAARAHFGCSVLDGAEVENSGGGGTAGAHWEMRVFGPELMTGAISRRSYLSNVTVTFMRMLGTENGHAWYPWVNVSMTDDAWYGKDAGCEFAIGSCKGFIDLEKYKATKPRTPSFPFCSSDNIKAYKEVKKEKSQSSVDLGTCSPDHATVLRCMLKMKDGLTPKELAQKWSFYYHVDKEVRGTNELQEYCPAFVDSSDGHKDTNCYNTFSQPNGSHNYGAELFGGKWSGCFEQATPFYMTDCRVSRWKSLLIGQGKTVAGFSGAGCYQFECDNGRLLVRAAGEKNRYGAKVCWAEGGTVIIRRMIDVDTFVYGEILCPPCTALCQHCEPDIAGFTSRDQLEAACQRGSTVAHLSAALMLLVLAVQHAAYDTV